MFTLNTSVFNAYQKEKKVTSESSAIDDEYHRSSVTPSVVSHAEVFCITCSNLLLIKVSQIQNMIYITTI